MAKPADASKEDPLVTKAFDKDKHAELARAVEQLSPEEAQFFLDKLERALKKRRLQLIGYLAALLLWVAGMLVAFALNITIEAPNWVFLMPFAAVGVVLYVFGRVSDRVGRGK